MFHHLTIYAAVVTATLFPRFVQAAEIVRLKTDTAFFGVDDRGRLSAIQLAPNGRDLLAPGQPAPVLQVRVGDKFFSPSAAEWDAKTNRLSLQYDSPSVKIVLAATAVPTHVKFEVAEVQPADCVELVLWGPYPTTIGDIIGEIVGVARDPNVAIGIQSLNAKTLGGYPDRESDIIKGWAIDDTGKYPDLSPELNKVQGFRGNTAFPTKFGSVLQAYCRDRSGDRIIENWNIDKYVVPAFHDGGVLGSKIALFACPAGKALDTIGAIELAEGLPHPMLDGVWAKQSPKANSAYLIVDFSEASIDRAIELAKIAGLTCVYHSSPFETWGHFKLKPSLFPNGVAGLKACAEKAKLSGISIGVHTLSNFTTPNDAYVTPRPDPRLARIGSSPLAADVDAAAQEIPVENPEYFQKKTALNTAMVGEELVRYDGVSPEAPWRLLKCQRGAWGTKAASHRKGESVGKLLDHPYNVFLTNAELAEEEARNLAALCNAAGVRQISMDGLEGNWSTGYGQYGRILFAKAWYDALDPSLRGQMRSDASNPAHFNWHINTFFNWGEPWYAGFRESQTLYRFKNQMFYERNLLPRMLGWFSLRNDTTLADAEWLLARAAGYDAGFALAVSPDSMAQQDAAATDSTRANNATPAILDAIRQWETARVAGAFPPNVKADLRDNAREFQLEPVGPGQWDLFPMKDGRRGEPLRIQSR